MVGTCRSCGAHLAIKEAGLVSPAKPPVAMRTKPISFGGVSPRRGTATNARNTPSHEAVNLWEEFLEAAGRSR